jgi:hypothetical protein
MSRLTRLTAALLVLLAAASVAPAAPAPDDNSPLALVPESAPIVVYVRGVEAAKDRLIATIKKALPEHAGTVETFLNKTWTDGTPDGRKLRGLVKKGPVFAVFTEMPKPPDEPKVAVVLAVTNYTEFRDNILTEEERKSIKAETGFESATVSGETLYFVDKKEFAVVTPDKDVAKSFTKKQKGIDGRISKEQADKLLGSDVGVYVSMDAMNKEYAEQIKKAKESAHEGIKTISESVDKSQRGTFALLEKIIDPAFQAVEDSQGLLFTVEFRPTGFAFHLQTELRADTPTAKALAGARQSAFKGMDGLPSGQLIYVGMEANKWIMAVSSEMTFGASTDAASKEGKALRAAIDELVAADPGTILSAYSLPMRGVQVSHFGDAAKAFDAQTKLLQALGSGTAYGGGFLKGKPTITPKAEKFKDIEFTHVEMKWDPEKIAEAGGPGGVALSDEMKKQLGEAFKKMMGEGVNTWVGTDGKAVLQITAKDWADARKLLEDHFNGTGTAGSTAAFRDVRKELPAEATVVTLIDFVRYAGIILDFAKPIIENSVPLPLKIPSAPANAPATYSGAAITLKGDRAGLDIFISAETVHGFYLAYVQPILQGFGGGAPGM